jgi:hypothetical protein
MQLFNSVFLISLISTVSALAPRSSVNGACTGAGGAPGVCIATASCSSGGGSYISNACPGTAADIKCCVKTSCGSGGSCKWTSQCSGTTQSGLCPGPSDFKCCLPSSGGGSGTLPGLNAVQTRNARSIIARTKVDFAASQQKRACYVAITTAFQESSIRILANSNYPDSLNYPHDGVGSDHDSVGIFQQRASWGSTKDRMNAVCLQRPLNGAFTDFGRI